MDEPRVAQLNASLGTRFDAHQEYSERFSRFGGAAVGVASLVVGYAAVRIRRVELAAALHDGVRRADLWITILLESLAWVLPPLAAGLVASTHLLAADGMPVVLSVGGRVLLPGTLLALAGVSLGVAVTRERDLFRYSKER